MQAIREYVIRIVAISILCSIILKLIHASKSTQQIMKTICGIIIAITVISPILTIAPKGFPAALLSIPEDGREIAQQASENSNKLLRSVISENTEAYIVSKASSFDCSLDVCVEVDNGANPLPVAVVLRGDISPFAKKKMQDIIENEIGIPKEQQIWN